MSGAPDSVALLSAGGRRTGAGRVFVLWAGVFALSSAGCGMAGMQASEVAYRWGERGAGAAQIPADVQRISCASRGQMYWLRVVPPAGAEAQAVVSLDSKVSEVWQGQTRLHVAGQWPVHTLPVLGEPVWFGYPCRERTFELAPLVFFGRSHELTAGLLRGALPPFAVGVTLLVLGALLLVLGARRRQWPVLHLAWFAGGQGAMLVGNAPPVNLVLAGFEPWPWAPGALRWVMEITNILVAASFSRYVDHVFLQGSDRWFVWVSRASVALVPVGVVLSLLFVVSMSQVREWSYAFTLVAIGRTLWVVLPRAARGDRDARIFVAGFALLVAISGTGILDGMGLWRYAPDFTHYGMLAFVLSLGLILERRLQDQADALRATSGELTATVARLSERASEVQGLNRELRAQIAQRSRELAEALARPELRPARLAEGDVVDGRYRVVRSLGRGGMGEVFEVERMPEGRRLALKVLSDVRGSASAQRFAREAEIAASVEHPNLVRIVDVGYQTGVLFLVMELVAGGSLEGRREAFGEPRWGVPVLAGVARGLSALHQAGVVHRDLKPANVLLVPEGEGLCVKITDFGIATFGEPLAGEGETASVPPGLGETASMPAGVGATASMPPSEGPAATIPPGAGVTASMPPASGSMPAARLSLTATGALAGTPHYIAPELARGMRDARPPSDIWSFGVLAHEVLTGEKPFATPVIYDAIDGQEPTRPPSLGLRALPLTRDLLSLLDACLAIDPALRPTAAALAERLEREARASVRPG